MSSIYVNLIEFYQADSTKYSNNYIFLDIFIFCEFTMLAISNPIPRPKPVNNPTNKFLKGNTGVAGL